MKRRRISILLSRTIAATWVGTCIVLSANSYVHARPGRSSESSTFRHAPTEKRIEAPVGEEENHARPSHSQAAPAPETEDLEEQLYLRERPDNLGQAARSFENHQLERLLSERERLVSVRRGQAIDLLEQFVRDEPSTAIEMPDALLRLAELRWESAREEYLKAFNAWQQVPEANRGRKPEPDYRASMAFYDRILTQHRDFDRYDLVLYMKAYALVELERTDEALAQYRRILAEFPESRFVPDAHMALAEAAFTMRYDYAAALPEYEKVLKYPDSGLYDIALFKSAWCLWRLGRSRDAATRFRQVLDLGQNRRQLTAAQRRRLQELQDEALNYLIQVFTEDERNTAADVFKFLEEIGGERYASRVLGRLSDTYFDQARYDRSIEAYRLLLKLESSSPSAVDYQLQIVAAYAAMDDEPHTVEEIQVLVNTYGPDGAWARQQADPEVPEQGWKRAERVVRRQALLYHETGQRERQRKKFESAVNLYNLYLQHFGSEPAAYEVQFFVAEILFHRLERFAEAGDAYLKAARMNRRGRYTRDALYNAIGAFEEVRERELQSCVRPQDRQQGTAHAAENERKTETRVCGESDNDRKFSEAIELYVELFPTDPDLPEILFRQGRFYHEREIYDPAVRLFGQLIEKYPSSEFAAPAGELILDSFNRAKDYANIEKWARRLKGAPSFQAADKQRRLNGLILQAMFKVGEQLAEAGKHGEAADAYLRAADEFPSDDRARQALYNAGVERQKAGDLTGAAQAYDRLIERYPGSREGALGAWEAAQMYESIVQFRDAAHYYETYHSRFAQGEKAKDALYNAVLLRLTADDNDAAVQAGQQFLREHPRDPLAQDVAFFVGRAYENNGRWREAAETYRRYFQSGRDLDRKVEAGSRLAQVLIRDDKRREADRVLEETVRMARRNASKLGQGLYYGAQARYLQGDQILARYEAIRIEGDVGTLSRRLQEKSELLQRAALAYADVVDFRVAEWVAAALFQIGRSYELFADAMRQAPIPEGLNEEEEQVYRDELARFVVPMEERALEAYEGGYQKALELKIYNTWTQKLREALTRLNDVQYPPLREAGGTIANVSPLETAAPLDGLRRTEATQAPPKRALRASR